MRGSKLGADSKAVITNGRKSIKSIDKGRRNRTNVTPNGAVVPKREFNLEYNSFV